MHFQSISQIQLVNLPVDKLQCLYCVFSLCGMLTYCNHRPLTPALFSRQILSRYYGQPGAAGLLSGNFINLRQYSKFSFWPMCIMAIFNHGLLQTHSNLLHEGLLYPSRNMVIDISNSQISSFSHKQRKCININGQYNEFVCIRLAVIGIRGHMAFVLSFWYTTRYYCAMISNYRNAENT